MINANHIGSDLLYLFKPLGEIIRVWRFSISLTNMARRVNSGRNRPSSFNSAPQPNAVESAVWHWSEADQAERTAKARRATRIGGVTRGLVGLAVSGLLYVMHHRALAELGASLSLLISALALLSPTLLYLLVQRGLSRLSSAVGSAVGFTVLVPFYYLFFVPFGLLFRRGSADPLERSHSKGATSYWKTRPNQSPDIKQYERQF